MIPAPGEGSHEYEYGVLPPNTPAVAVPLAALKHFGLVPVTLSVKAGGWVMVTLVEAIQPEASVADTVYTPAVKLVPVPVFWPLLQLYTGKPGPEVPPVTVVVAIPLLPPKQLTLVCEVMAIAGPEALGIVAAREYMQPLLSFTCTV